MAVKCLVKVAHLLKGCRHLGSFALTEKGLRGPAESSGHLPLGQPCLFSGSSAETLVISEEADRWPC